MKKLTLLRPAVLALASLTCLGGCFADSIQPWLQPDSIMERELDLEGDWKLVNEDWKDKYSVNLDKKKDSRSIELQSYYIKIGSPDRAMWFHFSGDVHEVNGIKLIQISNFSHDYGEVFSLANRPTVSLWQIAYDEDNIILWAPGFVEGEISALETMQDSDDKLLIVDSTENIQAYVEEWVEKYPEMKGDIRRIMPIILTRAGTEFEMPEEMRDLVPRVYEELLKKEGD